MRKSRSEMFFGKFCVRTKWMISIRIFLVNKTYLKTFLLSQLPKTMFSVDISCYLYKTKLFLIQSKPCR